jgi:hypothetical protein
MSDVAHVLRAGGMVPAKAKVDKSEAVDDVVARAYAHPVLPGRVVVRLTAATVIAGDDLEMATLGFGAGESGAPVAKERRRPLGFPGWALVNDPKNARYALDVVKEFKKQARKARSKPGHAKEGIDKIAATLGKTVPHFLPSFFEEAGRAFIEAGAQSHAATMFGKAREAEAVHALEVDEQHRIDGFLEFALAGAVTTKALVQYAKDLGESHKPADAYAHFRRLCVQRTLGGVPPWAGMAKELRRMAKAAKLDPDAEDAELIAEIIESPALGKAAGELWRAYEEPIVALAKDSPKIRGLLLNLFPTGSTNQADVDEAWLDLVDKSGAIEALRGDAPEEARPTNSRAAWFDKLAVHLTRSWRTKGIVPRAFELLRRIAPALIADGKPIKCMGNYSRLDLDLVELALELGVPVEVPATGVYLDVDEWASRVTQPERGRDPVRAAEHPSIKPLLVASVANRIGAEPFDSAARGKAGFLAAKRAFVEGCLTVAADQGVPAAAAGLRALEAKANAATFAEMPDLHARLAALDVAPALARTLRLGIVDEFGWPALEEAVAELEKGGATQFTLHGGPLAAIAATKTKLIAVGPTGRLGEHDVVVPAKHEFATARFIGGEFLVILSEYSTAKAYWSSAPHDLFATAMSGYWVPQLAARSATLPDGAWLEGKPIRRGDRTVELSASFVACDGTTVWQNEYVQQAHKHQWRELGAGGDLGRISWPAFIEAGVDPSGAWSIDVRSSLVPVPPELASNPLGYKDGFAGIRLRERKTPTNEVTHRDAETVDGMRWSSPNSPSESVKAAPVALIRFPGSDEPRLLEQLGYWRNEEYHLTDHAAAMRGSTLTFNEKPYWTGSVWPYPAAMWLALSPRDEAGSRRLRKVTDDDARALIAAATDDKADACAALPELVHARLRRGVSGLAHFAGALAALRDRLVAERSPDKAAAPVAAGPDDDALQAALGAWVGVQWARDTSAWVQIARTAEWFGAEDRSDRIQSNGLPSAKIMWMPLVFAPHTLAYVAAAIGTATPQRVIAAQFLAHLVQHFPHGSALRYVYAKTPLDMQNSSSTAPGYELRWRGGNAYGVQYLGWSRSEVAILEYAPSGAFADLPGMAPSEIITGGAMPTADYAVQLVAAVAAGKTSWSPDGAAEVASATGLTNSEAAYLLAGMPKSEVYGANFLDKEVRELLGMKTTQAVAARDSMKAVPIAKRRAAVDAAARGAGTVDALFDGTLVRTLATAWIGAVGRRTPIPEELITDADRELWAPMEPTQALAMIGNAAEAPQLATDATWALNNNANVIRVSSPEPFIGQTAIPADAPAFDTGVMQTVLVYLPFMFAELPVGHALLESAAVALERVQDRLRSPSLWFEGGSKYMQEKEVGGIDKLLDALGGEPLANLDPSYRAMRVRGAVFARAHNRIEMKLHPATLDAKALAHIGKLAAEIDRHGVTAWRCLELARGADYAAFVARIRKSPVPDGGWEQNPMASAPKLVAKAAKHLELGEEAAALYLQYLTLLWPTPKNVQQWNGWKPKQVDAANAELLDKELVLEAKRERAQRTHFLPGGWEALKSPNPPFETWKLPFYGERTMDSEGRTAITAPLYRFLATAPFHLLFERAWARIEADDIPRYEEVKR